LPDGERIACISERKLRLLSATDGTVLATYEHRAATSASAALSPDGAVVLVAHFDGGVSARRLSDGATIFDVPASDHGGIHRIALPLTETTSSPSVRCRTARSVCSSAIPRPGACCDVCTAARGMWNR
jgi:hypothetical protein